MRNSFHKLEAVLNKYTMYKGVLYGLAAILAVGELLALFGVISISAIGLPIAVLVLLTVCYLANRGFSQMFSVPSNTESWAITALILACILPPPTTVERTALIALAGIIAMASKYLLAFRRMPVFNPAAIAALVMSLTGLLPATWWIATPYMAFVTIIIGLGTLRKQRKFSMFAAFAISALAVMVYSNVLLDGGNIGQVLSNGLLSWPIIFLGTIMLTEPSTLPPKRYTQVLLGVLVGAIFVSQLRVGIVTATPQVALIIGNLFIFAVALNRGYALRLTHSRLLGKNLHELIFEKPKQLQYEPGQYMEWTLAHGHTDQRGNRRSFTIASSPTESDVRLGIKTYEPSSSFKRALLQLKPGTYLRGSRVAGEFTMPDDTKRSIVWIAGGIGITPFRSMAKYLIDTNQRRDITLFYAARENEFAYMDIFEQAKAIGLRTFTTSGRLELTTHGDAVPELRGSIVYVAGPELFVDAQKQALRKMGVPSSHIKTDHFSGY